MDPVTVEVILQGYSCCTNSTSYTDCNSCPYNTLEFDNCCNKLRDDVMEALRRLKVLETPTATEQPKLPFIEDLSTS